MAPLSYAHEGAAMAASDRTPGRSADDFDGIDPSIPAGTLEYWKARARQWQIRCQRTEREKTELIAELLSLQGVRSAKGVHAAERRAAVLRGDVLPGTGRAPKAL